MAATIVVDGTGMLRFDNAGVQPGARYGYRLGIREGEAERFYGETWVSVPALALALEELRPNPVTGQPVASFTLPNGSPARLGRAWARSCTSLQMVRRHSVPIADLAPLAH